MQILSGIARGMLQPEIQSRIMAARDANEAFRILDRELGAGKASGAR